MTTRDTLEGDGEGHGTRRVRRSRRTWSAGLLAIVHLASWSGLPAFAAATQGVAAAQAMGTQPFGTLGLTDSAELSGPEVLSGTLFDSAGRPAAGQVVAYAWPNNEALAAMSPGAEFRIVPVARAQADDSGSFLLRFDPAVDLAPFTSSADAGPVVNMDVVASDGAARTVYSVPRALTLVDGVLTPTVPVVADGLTSTLAPVELHLDTLAGAVEALLPTALDTTLLNREAWPSYCNGYLVSDYSPSWVQVGETLTSSSSTAKFTYSTTASSTLGVGVSATGDYGSFSASGTHSTSSTSAIDFGTTPADTKRFHRTQYKYGKYRVACASGGGTYYDYRTKPRQFVGGASNPAGSGIPTDQPVECANYAAGTAFSRTSNAAVTWSGGVSIKASIGIDLSARTGISTTAKLSYWFQNPTNLCGWNNPPTTATRIEAYTAK